MTKKKLSIREKMAYGFGGFMDHDSVRNLWHDDC